MTQLYIHSLNTFVDGLLFGTSLHDWIYKINDELASKYEMKAIAIENGDFGYESYACVLLAILKIVNADHIMESIQGKLDYAPFIEIAHVAWCANYRFWKNKNYCQVSKKGINMADRNDRCTTDVINLNIYDLNVYTDIISNVFKILAQQVLNAGMQKLSI